MRSGFVKLWRKVLDSDIIGYGPNTGYLAHILLSLVSYRDGELDGVEVGRGQALVSQRGLAEFLKMTHAEIRVAFGNLEKCKFVELKTHKQGTLVTVKKFAEYQRRGDDFEGDIDASVDTFVDNFDENSEQHTKQHSEQHNKQHTPQQGGQHAEKTAKPLQTKDETAPNKKGQHTEKHAPQHTKQHSEQHNKQHYYKNNKEVQEDRQTDNAHPRVARPPVCPSVCLSSSLRSFSGFADYVERECGGGVDAQSLFDQLAAQGWKSADGGKIKNLAGYVRRMVGQSQAESRAANLRKQLVADFAAQYLAAYDANDKRAQKSIIRKCDDEGIANEELNAEFHKLQVARSN